MKLELELWQAILLLIAFFGMVGGFGKLLLDRIDKQLDERFKAQATLLQGNTDKVTQLEREFLTWRADLPLHYVRREDYVRGQSVIEAKLDALYNKLEVVQMKGTGHGG